MKCTNLGVPTLSEYLLESILTFYHYWGLQPPSHPTASASNPDICYINSCSFKRDQYSWRHGPKISVIPPCLGDGTRAPFPHTLCDPTQISVPKWPKQVTQGASTAPCPAAVPVFRNPFFLQSECVTVAPRSRFSLLALMPRDRPTQALISSVLMAANQKIDR